MRLAVCDWLGVAVTLDVCDCVGDFVTVADCDWLGVAVTLDVIVTLAV